MNHEKNLKDNAQELRDKIIGRSIVSAEIGGAYIPDGSGNYNWDSPYVKGLVIELDGGQTFVMEPKSSPSYVTKLAHMDFQETPSMVTDVTTSNDGMKWHVLTTAGQTLNLDIETYSETGMYLLGFDLVDIIPARKGNS